MTDAGSLALRGCTGCCRNLPLTAFSKHANKRDGLQPRCKSCVKKYYDTFVPADVLTNTKKCTTCKQYRPKKDFSPHKGRRDGLQSICCICRRDQENLRRRNGKAHITWIKTKYGLSLQAYELLVQQQQGVCAICGQLCVLGRLCVDHNHTTHKVRGLLCNSCNTGLGYFKDNPQLLEAAAQYLHNSALPVGF